MKIIGKENVIIPVILEESPNGDCDGCAFYDLTFDCSRISNIDCSARSREDGKNVIYRFDKQETEEENAL
ncbi:hypothetical protein [Dysgonomonas sp. 520]|uniref:hypothetical protein n=1 Tax=Dysgonomonas sp. 520 TaxID=2302931 RepID=UPI0013D2BA15|nr:hypothetical protein [Dysgonomonas sp. 520]NDW10471.1 hypothetical protein [Dysgonomonas sp. 520]